MAQIEYFMFIYSDCEFVEDNNAWNGSLLQPLSPTPACLQRVSFKGLHVREKCFQPRYHPVGDFPSLSSLSLCLKIIFYN